MTRELKEWQARDAALASGQEWIESHTIDTTGQTLTEDEADSLIASGQIQRCKQCTSPHQVVYHTRPYGA